MSYIFNMHSNSTREKKSVNIVTDRKHKSQLFKREINGNQLYTGLNIIYLFIIIMILQ